jgi:hypothetical protein
MNSKFSFAFQMLVNRLTWVWNETAYHFDVGLGLKTETSDNQNLSALYEFYFVHSVMFNGFLKVSRLFIITLYTSVGVGVWSWQHRCRIRPVAVFDVGSVGSAASCARDLVTQLTYQLPLRSRGSSVSIVTWLRGERPGFKSRQVH